MPNRATYTGLSAGAAAIGAVTLAQMTNVNSIVTAVIGVALLVGGWLLTRGSSGFASIGGGAMVGAGAGLLVDAGLDAAGL